MRLKTKHFLILALLVITSCAHKSGRYVLRGDKWVFVPKKAGFNQFFHDGKRIDNHIYNLSDDGQFVWPVPSSKRVSSHFGQRKGRHHDGVDIPAVSGTHIVASATGKVIFSGKMRGYGNIVIVGHKGGYHTVYAHNRKHYVKKGQKVSQGEVIAQVGSTGRSSGPHLHFEIRRKNRVRNPAHYLARLKKFFAKR